ncbi:MAG TPA: antibiotic biosynthesis monooxygenase [Terriglobales bacterium]|jgi:heme-degrading monooxygenase HmoA|nr:antibiotic biosynthesis monooxygenase [Terriglobales bacterium]
MFARIVSLRLKPNTQAEFAEKFEKDVIPTLRKQQGFQDEITFVAPNGTEVAAISLWDSKENAENYNRTTYPEVLKTLAKVIEGTPEVRPFEVVNSTSHKIAARAAA